MSADRAARSSSSRSMRLMKDLSWSLAKPDLAIGRSEISKAGDPSLSAGSSATRPSEFRHPCLCMNSRIHVRKRGIQDRLEAQRKSLCRLLLGNQVLPYLDQDMRQAAQRAVLIQGVALKRAAIGLVVADGKPCLFEPRHQGFR